MQGICPFLSAYFACRPLILRATQLRKIRCSLSTAPPPRPPQAADAFTSSAAAAAGPACERCKKHGIECTTHLLRNKVPQSVYGHARRDANADLSKRHGHRAAAAAVNTSRPGKRTRTGAGRQGEREKHSDDLNDEEGDQQQKEGASGLSTATSARGRPRQGQLWPEPAARTTLPAPSSPSASYSSPLVIAPLPPPPSPPPPPLLLQQQQHGMPFDERQQQSASSSSSSSSLWLPPTDNTDEDYLISALASSALSSRALPPPTPAVAANEAQMSSFIFVDADATAAQPAAATATLAATRTGAQDDKETSAFLSYVASNDTCYSTMTGIAPKSTFEPQAFTVPTQHHHYQAPVPSLSFVHHLRHDGSGLESAHGLSAEDWSSSPATATAAANSYCATVPSTCSTHDLTQLQPPSPPHQASGSALPLLSHDMALDLPPASSPRSFAASAPPTTTKTARARKRQRRTEPQGTSTDASVSVQGVNDRLGASQQQREMSRCVHPPPAYSPRARHLCSHGKASRRHLINLYLVSVHIQFPVVDPAALRADFDRAAQDVGALDPATKVICAAVEAWAARFSLHPLVIGKEFAAAHAQGPVRAPTLRSQSPRDCSRAD